MNPFHFEFPPAFRRPAALVAVTLLGCGSQGAEIDQSEPTTDARSALVSAHDPMATGLSRTSGMGQSNYDCLEIGCSGFEPVLGTVATKRTRGSNSQLPLSHNVYMGDVDGDGQADLIQHDDHRIFASRADISYSEIAHAVLPETITRLIVGDFFGAGWDQVCALSPGTAAGTERVHCMGVDPALDDQFRLMFNRSGSIKASEDVIVGDYDGDKRDEMFLYDAVAGTYRMLEYDRQLRRFGTPAEYHPGNLAGRLVAGMKVRAGDINGDGKADLVLVDSAGRLQVLTGSRDTTSNVDTFWFWFRTTGGAVVAAAEDALLARVNDDAKDDLVLHNRTTGAIRFLRVDLTLATISMDLGQARIAAGSVLRMNWSHPLRNEPGADMRDDMFFRDGSSLYLYEARYSQSQSKLTYWFEQSRRSLDNHYGWPTTQKKALFLRCKFNDLNDEPGNALFPALYSRIIDYYYDVTMGALDLSSSEIVTPWQRMARTVANAGGRQVSSDDCVAASGKDPSDYDIIVTFLNAETDWGASGNRAILPPAYADVWVTIQEITHALGISHHTGNNNKNYRPGGYGNPFDPMSGATVGYTYANPLGEKEGPGFTSGNLRYLGAIADQRTLVVPLGAAKATYTLSAINRPATGEPMQLQLVRANDSDTYTSVEYREPTGFDRAIPRPTVLIHYVKPASKLVQLMCDRDAKDPIPTYDADSANTTTPWPNAERQPGESYTMPGKHTIRVLSFDTTKHTAQIEVEAAP